VRGNQAYRAMTIGTGSNAHRQLSQALQTRLRWSCIGRVPESGAMASSSFRFFLGWEVEGVESSPLTMVLAESGREI
jgi:hypothetical protein